MFMRLIVSDNVLAQTVLKKFDPKSSETAFQRFSSIYLPTGSISSDVISGVAVGRSVGMFT